MFFLRFLSAVRVWPNLSWPGLVVILLGMYGSALAATRPANHAQCGQHFVLHSAPLTKSSVTQNIKNLVKPLQHLDQVPNLAEFQKNLAMLTQQQAEVASQHDGTFWALENVLAITKRQFQDPAFIEKQAPIFKSTRPQFVDMIKKADRWGDEVVLTNYAPLLGRPKQFWMAVFAAQKSFADLAALWKSYATNTYNLARWLERKNASGKKLIQQGNMFELTARKYVNPEATIITEGMLAQRLPEIFNLYMQEMALRLQKAGVPAQYSIERPDEVGATGQILVRLEVIGGKSGDQKFHFNFNPHKITDEELWPLKEFFNHAFSEAQAWAQQECQFLPPQSKRLFRIFVIKDLMKAIQKNAQAQKFQYTSRTQGTGNFLEVAISPEALWDDPYETGGVLTHELHHTLYAENKVEFSLLDPQGNSQTSFTALRGTGYEDFFSFDEVGARLAELGYYQKVLQDLAARPLDRQMVAGKTLETKLGKIFEATHLMAQGMLNIGTQIMQEALEALTSDAAEFDLGELNGAYLRLKFKSATVDNPDQRVTVVISKYMALGEEGVPADITDKIDFDLKFHPFLDPPEGMDEFSEEFDVLRDKYDEQFAANYPAEYVQVFKEGAIKHIKFLLKQAEKEEQALAKFAPLYKQN